MRPEIAIIGGGLAGCSMAWACLRLGARVRLYDQAEPMSASRVAAGLVTPLTGHNLAISWRLEELYAAALQFYRSVEADSGMTLFDLNTTLRIFTTTAEAEFARTRAERFAPYLVPELIPEWIEAPQGAVGLRPAARLRVPEYLMATRVKLGDAWQVGEVDLAVPLSADWVVYCHGLAANPHFARLIFRPTKGEVLTLNLPQAVGETRTVNRNGTWLTPQQDDTFLAGSTYDHHDLSTEATAKARADILRRLATFVRGPVRVVDHRAGVRPILDASRPVLASLPHKRLAYFNGLGSKGVLTAPYFAQQLAKHLLQGEPLDPAVDAKRFTQR